MSWNIFCIRYETVKDHEGKSRHFFAGYAAVYLYYAYPENVRPRIGWVLWSSSSIFPAAYFNSSALTKYNESEIS